VTTVDQSNSLIQRLTLELPHLPDELDGLTLLQISDLHVRRPTARHEQLIREMDEAGPVDLLMFVGDYMQGTCRETAAVDLLNRLADPARRRIGAFGVFGNHDCPELRERVADLPVTWLADDGWTDPQRSIGITGINCAYRRYGGDLLTTLQREPWPADQPPALRILLAHMPIWIGPAADAGIHLVLSGHTHGGQCRLPGPIVLHNGYGNWPLNLSSGILQLRHTRCVVSRGMGETVMEGLRVFCPPHAPLITLRCATQPQEPIEQLSNVHPW
jgi:hypothetical protein